MTTVTIGYVHICGKVGKTENISHPRKGKWGKHVPSRGRKVRKRGTKKEGGNIPENRR
jgi:hypothetical protein